MIALEQLIDVVDADLRRAVVGPVARVWQLVAARDALLAARYALRGACCDAVAAASRAQQAAQRAQEVGR